MSVSDVKSLFKAGDPQIKHIISTYERILSVYEILRPMVGIHNRSKIVHSDTTKGPYRFELNSSTHIYRISGR